MELEQLRVAYETLGMSPEEIASDRELDVAAVKAGLMQVSSSYRKACNAAPLDDSRLNFSDQDLEDVNDVIRRLAHYAESEELQFKAATYIRDDKKGRKEVVRAVGNTTFNILAFNENLKAMREQAQRVKDRVGQGKLVDV